jgi:hypothetical protein
MADGIIGKNSVDLSESWGNIKFYDYTFVVDTKRVLMDFQDLMVAVSEKRAVAVEGEVNPMSVRMRARNTYLDQLGAALAEATKVQAAFDSQAEGGAVMSGWLTKETVATIRRAGAGSYLNQDNPNVAGEADATKAGIEGIIQKLKSTIDGLNNEAQTDMTRLQGLIDRRDESYSTATNLMTAISDTRSNLIRNL